MINQLEGGQFCPQPAFSRLGPAGLWLAVKPFVFNPTRSAKIFVKRAPEHAHQPQIVQSGPAGGPAESRLRAKLPALQPGFHHYSWAAGPSRQAWTPAPLSQTALRWP